MNKQKISAKELRTLFYPLDSVIPVAMNVMEKHFRNHEAFEILKVVLQSLKDYATDEVLMESSKPNTTYLSSSFVRSR